MTARLKVIHHQADYEEGGNDKSHCGLWFPELRAYHWEKVTCKKCLGTSRFARFVRRKERK